MARRIKSLHHNLKSGDSYRPGENIVFHREHRSPRNRSETKYGILQKYKRSNRRKFKQEIKNDWIDKPLQKKFKGRRKLYEC